MRQSFLMPAFDHRGSASYEVRVRGTMVLWGSAGITVDTGYTKPLLLHVRNHVFGEVVTVGTQVASGARTVLGTLQPGESFSIPIQNISGVFATCALETGVDCQIHTSS
jgi:hypothetical protein